MTNLEIGVLVGTAILVLVMVYLAILMRGSSRDNSAWKNQVKFKLDELRSISKSQDLMILRHGLIDADKLLDFVLKQKGYRGDTMGERLKSAKGSYSKDVYQKIWEAHKLRNKLVHELDVRVSSKELKDSIYFLKVGVESLL